MIAITVRKKGSTTTQYLPSNKAHAVDLAGADFHVFQGCWDPERRCHTMQAYHDSNATGAPLRSLDVYYTTEVTQPIQFLNVDQAFAKVFGKEES